MKFSELEKIMLERGVLTLADISRFLDTTPQAVSNWKARDQVPHHIAGKLTTSIPSDKIYDNLKADFTNKDQVSFSDILLTISEHLKVAVLVPFVVVFLTFTYVQFIKVPQYESWASVLLPEDAGTPGGLAGLASSFGINIPIAAKADLSSPTLFPELMTSRTFAEIILQKKFYTEKFGEELSLLSILTNEKNIINDNQDELIAIAMSSFGNLIEFKKTTSSPVSEIKVTTFEPEFSQKLAESILKELENLNRYYKSKSINEKTNFIEQRISSVQDDLEFSEISLKEFSEKNRQISSPSLQLEYERLSRDVEIQKGIYLTLKQQLELAKIEEVQQSTIVQVLDRPQIPLYASNKNIKMSILLSGFLGSGLGLLLIFFRSYLIQKDNINERRKLRRVSNFIKKKSKELFLDRRISGIVSILFLIGLPFYLGYESKNPVFFNKYSTKLMIVNTLYVLILIISISLFIYISKKHKNAK